MQRAAAPYILILPSFLLAAAIILWPLKEIVSLSLHDVNRFGMLRDFIGMEHFRVLFADPDFIAATWRTLVWTAAVVLGTLIVSVPIALILNEDFYGRGVARILKRRLGLGVELSQPSIPGCVLRASARPNRAP